MRIGFRGNLEDKKEIIAGFIGCGSHSFRNIYPVFQFAPVKLHAVCDLSMEKAEAFRQKFGAQKAYDNYMEMLENEKLDAVFIVTGYDSFLRPLYPKIATDCLNHGCHVWIEKPPAATTAEILQMKEAASKNGKLVAVGFKKMFFPANQKARELAYDKDFGRISMVMLQYPQYIPDCDEFRQYLDEYKPVGSVAGFLDHICHPVSLLIYLLGMPSTLYYERAKNGAGMAVFSYDSGIIASLALTYGSSVNGGMERTTIISDSGKHIIVDNNIKLSYHKTPPNLTYGNSPDFFKGSLNDTTAVWEPEFSLGQLYNKGLFLLGYYNEINEFANAVLHGHELTRGTLDDALDITTIFEKFAEGPQKLIRLRG